MNRMHIFCNVILIFFRQIVALQGKLLTLETIFDSVTAMTTIYRQELQSIIQYTYSDMPGILNTSNTIHKNAKVLVNNHSREMPKEFNGKQVSNASIVKDKDVMDVDHDVIYDNLVLRYTYV